MSPSGDHFSPFNLCDDLPAFALRPVAKGNSGEFLLKRGRESSSLSKLHHQAKLRESNSQFELTFDKQGSFD